MSISSRSCHPPITTDTVIVDIYSCPGLIYHRVPHEIMFLSDQDIQRALKSGEIIIKDFDPSRLQPASYDVLLGNDFMLFDKHATEVIDPIHPVEGSMRSIHVPDGEAFILHPNDFVLAVTKDYFGVGDKHCCEIMGKSSLARLGLIIHTTAGFVDPGNQLNATLELFNTNNLPVKLYPGMKIAQIAFCQLTSPSLKPYGHKDLGSKYYGATTVQGSQMWQNFKKNNKPKKPTRPTKKK